LEYFVDIIVRVNLLIQSSPRTALAHLQCFNVSSFQSKSLLLHHHTAPSSSSSLAAPHQRQLQRDLQLLDDSLPVPLLPPDTFSDSPTSSNSSRQNKGDHHHHHRGGGGEKLQQLRVQAHVRTGGAGDMENSVRHTQRINQNLFMGI
jgi:hypothetical protein